VRFRLGGACFPPLLFYRIFTHRPVADVGAFAPRNYSLEAAIPAPQHAARGTDASAVRERGACRADSSAPGVSSKNQRGSDAAPTAFDMPEAVRRYMKPDGRVGYRAQRGWYQRRENNGWRTVDEVRMALGHGLSGGAVGVALGIAETGVLFHHSTMVRREERDLRRKRRRREWLVAMYRCVPALMHFRFQPVFSAVHLMRLSAVSWLRRADLSSRLVALG
jgi:hypothetical protein